ncbi:MAG TPA: enoyl-CoA hydratase-related protein [Candidatus Limnocylindrales bacterium]|nr:enoyl-CoA hydratase-related protein [Candidatus Limnocylindrales bacterium]
MADSVISIDRPAAHAHIAVVTINRPRHANSLNPPALRELARAWREIAADDDVRCVVLTGAGERVFCSGMDLKETIPAAQAFARGERIDPEIFEGLRAVSTATLVEFDLGKPLICAINGHCRGGGFDLMLASEMRVAAEHATFALEEVALGLFPTGHAAVMLPRQIAWVHAQEIMMTARPLGARRALELGLLNRVVEASLVMETALELAAAVASNAPLAVAATRSGVRELLHLPLHEAYRRQEELGRPLRRTEDAREAQRAFVEKRKPIWKGR